MVSGSGGAVQPSIRLGFEQLRAILGRFEYFQHWTEEQIRECCILARVVQYAPQQTIALDSALPCVHLILSGQCMLLQYLRVRRIYGTERFQLVAPLADTLQSNPSSPNEPRDPDQLQDEIWRWHETFRARTATESHRRHESLEQQQQQQRELDPDQAISFVRTPPPEQQIVPALLDVGTLRVGAVFGLGERHPDRSIVARTRTQCLLIPRCWLLLKRQNIGNTWCRLRMYLDGAIPNRDALFEQFQRDRAWQRYRRRLVQQAPKPRPSRTRSADVPVMCRIAEARLQQQPQQRPRQQ
ncbi:uncharacterized protein LOC118467332 [Anopheles albimanus]|uniref:Cyclic nucleotide-binding domain-containing protein n=1 Tax=Anopheles albimanus TaxID=7167 RepID=A0A182FJQ7_ANOAL|nr:uncharacterized protein LOC118467332 [Anopheles albimanus]